MFAAMSGSPLLARADGNPNQPSNSHSPPGSTSPPDTTGAYRHDGFYFRFGLGPHYTYFFGTNRDQDVSIRGVGLGFEIALGGTLVDGIVVALTLGSASTSGDMRGAVGGTDHNTVMAAPWIALMLDWYPEPTGPWHFGGLWGVGGYSGHDSNDLVYTATSGAGGLFAGYDAWLSRQTAMGVGLFAMGAAPTRAPDVPGNFRLAPLSAGIRLSFLVH